MSALAWQILTLVRRVLIVVLTVVVLVRPSWGEAQSEIQTSDLDVLVVVDRTRSMIAEDGPGQKARMVQVKKDLKALSAAVPSVRLSAITFGGEVVRTEMPFTYDAAAFNAWVDGLYAERAFDGSGSIISAPVDEMVETLERDQERYPERRRIVVFVSDGENTATGIEGGISDQEVDQESFAEINALSGGGVVLGYGSAEGGRMPWDDERPQDGYLKDEGGHDARSRMDLDNLRKVANEMGLETVHRNSADTRPLGEIAATWDSDQFTEQTSSSSKVERAWMFGFPLLALMLWELWGHRRRANEAEEVLS